MKSKKLYKLAQEAWFPELKQHRFIEQNGRYIRILDSGVVHLLGIGMDPHGAETFRLMCGVDSVQIREDLELDFGFLKQDGLYHLTAKGWDYNSGRWPCETEEEARASLTSLWLLIVELALPYFEPITTLSDVGDEINEVRQPGLGWMKARLYLLDGDFASAYSAIEKYSTWAMKPRNWGSPGHQLEDIAVGERIRREIQAAAKAAGFSIHNINVPSGRAEEPAASGDREGYSQSEAEEY
jgi:hypothetical protein